ncbi:MAG: RNA ligase family protein, partial [Chthoniobacterales bacterium]
GYTPGEDGTPYQHTDKADEASGVHCQLLNPIEETHIPRYLNDARFCLQEKFDGHRMLIRKQGVVIEAINRKGLIIGVPCGLLEDIATIPGDIILDGESIGDDYFAFDVLEFKGADMRSFPYRDRLCILNRLKLTRFHYLHVVETAIDAASKAKFLSHFHKSKREGVVFKNLDAHYVAGRPASGGDQLKYKFYATASFLVDRIHPEKRSVSLKLLSGENSIPVGSVTIPPNKPIPSEGSIVEVRYLYAYPNGSIYQPVFLHQRNDIPVDACQHNQLKFKAA